MNIFPIIKVYGKIILKKLGNGRYILTRRESVIDQIPRVLYGFTASDNSWFNISFQTTPDFLNRRLECEFNLKHFIRSIYHSGDVLQKALPLDSPGPIKSPPKVQLLENLSVPLVIAVQVSGFITVFCCAFTFIYENRTKEGYCGVNKPIYSSANPFSPDDFDKSRKVYWKYFLPTNMFNTNSFLTDCALKTDSVFLQRDFFEQEIRLIAVYDDFVYYNSRFLLVFNISTQILTILVIGRAVRVLILTTLQVTLSVNLQPELVGISVVVFSGIVAKNTTDLLKITCGGSLMLFIWFLRQLKNGLVYVTE